MTARLPRAVWVVLLVVAVGCDPCAPAEPSCQQDADCPEDQVCQSGACVTLKSLPSNEVCAIDEDCAPGSVCRQGTCVRGLPQLDAGFRFDAGGSSGGPAGEGIIALTPSDVLDFGDPLPPPQTLSRSIIIRNNGSGPLIISAVARTAETSAEYTVTTSSSLPRTLQHGEEMRIEVVYGLMDGESDTGAVAITSNAGSCSFTCADPQNVRVALFSEFKGVRNLEVTPALHDFGFLDQGNTSTEFTFTARNDGTLSKILTVESITLAGADVAHFQLSLPSGTLPAYLQPGAVLDIPVTYKPTNLASHSASVVLRANSDNPDKREVTATVRGHSEPTVDVVVDALDLGHVEINQQTTRSTTIRNNSNVSITVGQGRLDSNGMNGFYLPTTPSPFPITIPSGGTAQLSLIFRPTGQAGNRDDILLLRHNLSTTEVAGEVTGVADPPPPPPGGPNLSVMMTFSRSPGDLSACPAAVAYNNQNMDLILEGGGGSCEKPQQISAQCPNDAFCQCSFGAQGGGDWRASGGVAPEPYTQEIISHNGQGGDGTFTVLNRYWDDCAVMWRGDSSTNLGALLQPMCDMAPCECFPISVFPYLYVDNCTGGDFVTCAGTSCIVRTSCYYQAAAVYGGKCATGGHQPSRAKTVVVIRSAGGQVVVNRAFCVPFQAASQFNKVAVVTLVREQGFFRIGSVAPGVTEVDPAQPCP